MRQHERSRDSVEAPLLEHRRHREGHEQAHYHHRRRHQDVPHGKILPMSVYISAVEPERGIRQVLARSAAARPPSRRQERTVPNTAITPPMCNEWYRGERSDEIRHLSYFDGGTIPEEPVLQPVLQP